LESSRPSTCVLGREPRALGAPTSQSKEVKDVRAAINNPRYNADKKRKRTEAIAMLTARGYKDRILPELAVEELVDEILTKPRPEFDNKSIIDLMDKAENNGLDYCMYVGFTKQRIPKEAFAFLGRRSANRPKKKNGETPLNRPVLLRGDRTLPENKRHFTAKQCRDELSMRQFQVTSVSSKSTLTSWRTRCRADCNATPWASDCGGRWPWAKERKTRSRKWAWCTRSL
jgi:hypothetical protein